jgi:DNA repair protein RadC
VQGQEVVVLGKLVSIKRVPIKDWPKSARPREKLCEQGPRALSDAELLAVLLRTGTAGRSAIDLAHSHIAAFGSLRELLTADWRAWKMEPDRAKKAAKKGMGLARYAALQAALELTRRHLLEPAKVGSVLSQPNAVQEFLRAQLRDRPYEVFCVLFLNSRHRLIAFEELFRGTTDAAQVYTREVLHRALARNAPAVILAHNHPSGDIDPSEADQAITRRIKEALALVDVRVLDHIIIGDGQRCFSFSEHGML